MNELKQTLFKIAKLFNGLNIKWSVGGSVLLEHYGLYENPHDIDIIVAEEDIKRAKSAIEKIGTKKQVPKSTIFLSDYYYKYDVGKVEVDLIACFKIKHDEGVYECKPEFTEKTNEGITYAALEDWLVLYLLMPKGEKKAETIERYFRKNINIDKVKIDRILGASLPKTAASRIYGLLNNA